MRLLPPSSRRHGPPLRRRRGGYGDGFTLVELLVSIVILTILASLMLAGLAAARQRSKADKTRSTIRKIDAVIRPMYESYRTRRVSAMTVGTVPTPTATLCPNCYAGSNPKSMMVAAWQQLVAKRRMIVEEMPDTWNDVYVNFAIIPSDTPAAARRYVRFRQSVSPDSRFGDAETLAMVTLQGGFDQDAAEAFRSDEIGDVDGDSAPEFLDGWGRPIRFIRWPAAFTSPLMDVQTRDPLDHARVTGDWALVPLIVSGGADASTNDPLDETGGFGMTLATKTWLGSTTNLTYTSVASTCTGNTMGVTTAAKDMSDNITNHDLVKK